MARTYAVRDAEPGRRWVVRRGPAARVGLSAGEGIGGVVGQSVRGPDAYRCCGLRGAPAGALVRLGLASGNNVQITAGRRA